MKTHSAGKEPTEIDIRKLGHEIAVAILASAVESGELDPRDKTDDELRNESLDYIRGLLAQKTEFRIIVDYRTNLLKEARRFRDSGSKEFACVFYATWLEHWFNNLIIAVGRRRKLPEDVLVQMIRELSLRAKVTWVPIFLGLKPLHNPKQNAILKLAELRNNFVHYKFQGKPEEIDKQNEKELEKAIEGIETIVKYLATYESRNLYHGKKRHIRKIMTH